MKRLPVYADQCPLQGLALPSTSALEHLHRRFYDSLLIQRSKYGLWISGESAGLVLCTARPRGDELWWQMETAGAPVSGMSYCWIYRKSTLR